VGERAERWTAETSAFDSFDEAFAQQPYRLSERQRRAARAWQRSDRTYEYAQRVARGAVDVDELSPAALTRALDFQQDLDDAISTGALPFPAVVFRGLRSLRKTFGVAHAAQTVGLRRREAGYFATSVVRSVALDEFTTPDGALLEVMLPVGTPALWLPLVGSRRLRRQGELLLPDDMQICIKSQRNDSPVAVLSVEVIAS
jgi:hypothetical protein